MSDLISRQAAIDALMGEPTDAHYPSWYAERLEQLPPAQQERIIYGNMSDEEFEKWLYGHGICSPNIHESIPCDAVPLLIDNAISELPSAQPEQRWIPCSERLPEIKQHVLLSCYDRVIYGRMISEDGNSGYPVFEICDSVGEKRPIVLETTVHSEFTTSRIIAWMPLPEPYKAESEDKE